MKKLSTEALRVLGASTVLPDNVSGLRLPEQMDRKLYVEVNKALEAIGGVWSRKLKVHLFQEDPEGPLSEILAQGGYTDSKQEFGFFETPEPLARNLVAAAEIKPGMTVLEPSAGRGALVRHILKSGGACTAIEIQGENADKIHKVLLPSSRDLPPLFVVIGNFLNWQPREGFLFDRVVMNPPFRAQADIAHVHHAFNFLKPGGRLVAIMSAGVKWRENRKALDFRKLVLDSNGSIIANPDGSFKASGTDVRTVTVIMEKV